MYFEKLQKKDEVFSLVYGKGIVDFMQDPQHRVAGFYIMKVKFDKCSVMYTEDGLPDWGRDKVQTLFYMDDISLTDYQIDFQEETLSKKQIHKYRDNDKLEMRCPSGIWRNVLNCPSKIVSKALSSIQYHLFRRTAKD